MILARSIESVFASNKEAILKLVYNENKKPTALSSLSLIEDTIDEQGRKYYRYPRPELLPLQRYGKLLEFMQYIAKGLSAEEDEQLDAVIETALEDGLKNPKKGSAVAIGACLEERKRRRKMCVHTELLYNYIAVQIVREDEQPEVFDNDIHLEKVATLKQFSSDGVASFFFTSPELKRLIDLLEMSKDDLQQSIKEYHLQRERFVNLLEVIRSRATSKDKDAILKK